MARPTIYKPEILEKAKAYIQNYKELGDAIPMVEGLAVELGVSRDTIYDWASQEDKQEFSDIVNTLRASKSRALQNGGITKQFDGRISALLLGHEGYRDKKDITSDDKPLEGNKIIFSDFQKDGAESQS